MLKIKSLMKSSLFIKIIVFNIISILVITLIYQGVFYNVIEKSWRNKFTKYNLSNIGISFNNIEREIINKTVSIPYNYFSNIPSNKSILYPLGQDISGSPEDIIKLINDMDLIAKNNPSIMSMDVYYPKTNTVVTGFKSVHFFTNDKERDKLIPWYQSFMDSKSNIKLLPLNNLNYPNASSVLTYIAKIPQYVTNSSDALVAMHIDLRSFSEYIDIKLGKFLIVNGNKELMLESGGEIGGSVSKYVTNILPKIEIGKGVQSVDIKTDNGDMVAIVEKSNVLDIYYMYIVPYKTFYQDYMNMTNLFLWMSFIFIILNLLVMAFISRKNNKTYVDRIVTISEKAGINFDNNRKSVDDSIEQLVSKISVLNTEIENSKPTLYQNTIRALIFDKATNESYIPLQIKNELTKVYSVIINILKDGSKNNILVANYLNEKAKEASLEYDVFFSSIEKTEIVAIICYKDGMFEGSLEWLYNFLKKENGVLGEYNITRGKAFDLTRLGIKDSFNNAMLVYKYRFIFPEQTELSFNDISFENLKNTGSHLKVLSQIERSIVGNSYLDVEKKIKGLVNAFKVGAYSIDYCMSTLRDLIAMLNKLIISSDLDMWVIFGYDIRNYFKQIPHIDAFEEWALSMCKVIIENKEEKKKKVNTDFEAELIKLVKENIENDISLDMLADRLNIRPDTLSKLFKSAVGMNYSEYIKDQKMEYAVELLLSDKYTVKEIAEKLGYNSIQYFIKMFKSTYGDTPHQYKKNILKK